MKLLSVVVPCYNSEQYMRKSIDSLLIGDDRIEIIIVNDGSSDNTAQIADAYQVDYPNQIRVIHKENGGHGSAVNVGIEAATGWYFKVLDSDDWFDEDALREVLSILAKNSHKPEPLDLLICNYVYEKVGVKHKKTMNYRKQLPIDLTFSWREVELPLGTYLMMHSLIHRTEILQKHHPRLPEHTFYVDSLFVFKSLPYTEQIMYHDVNLYRYYIGRDDQSVNEKVMIQRIDQQLRVNQAMIAYYASFEDKRSAMGNLMYHHLEIVSVISLIMIRISDTEESNAKGQQLLRDFEAQDEFTYQRFKRSFMGFWLVKENVISRRFVILFYRIAQKIFGFN